jgi:hypothetical protein
VWRQALSVQRRVAVAAAFMHWMSKQGAMLTHVVLIGASVVLLLEPALRTAAALQGFRALYLIACILVATRLWRSGALRGSASDLLHRIQRHGSVMLPVERISVPLSTVTVILLAFL